MGTFLIIVGAIALLSLIYLNTVATIIIFKAPDSVVLLNIIRSIIVWLIPVIGFSFSLRFSQQSFNCELHYKLLPGFLRNWIYDERLEPANSNVDRNYRQAVHFGLSEMSRKFRKKY